MRNKEAWDLTLKQRKKYLEAVKTLYGPTDKGSVGIVPPRVCIEDLGLTHEKPSQEQERSCRDGVGLGFAHKPSQHYVPRETSSPKQYVSRGTSKPKHLPEWREQAALVKWCKSNPLIAEDVIRIENERKRNMAQAHVAKMMGLHAGATDLFISYPFKGYHGFFIEMKQARNYTASERKKPSWFAQQEFIARKRKQGYMADFAFGADHGIMLISRYLGIS